MKLSSKKSIVLIAVALIAILVGLGIYINHKPSSPKPQATLSEEGVPLQLPDEGFRKRDTVNIWPQISESPEAPTGNPSDNGARQQRHMSPYEQGYDDGWDDGEYDGARGNDYGYMYDDGTRLRGAEARQYMRGYREGYYDGYHEGFLEWETYRDFYGEDDDNEDEY